MHGNIDKDSLLLFQGVLWLQYKANVFVLIFAVVQLCTAEYVIYGQKMTLHNTDPEPMSTPNNYPA